MLTLTPHQQAAVDAVVAAFTTDGKTLFAVRGYAGSGKTTLIKPLRDALRAVGIPVLVGSPTHRAAMILRSKEISDADTVHAHALTPYFTSEYAACVRWLGEECATRDPLPLDPGEITDSDMPLLLGHVMRARSVPLQELLQRRSLYPAKRVLASVGLHGRDYFDGFGSKRGEGCLIVDEASMVGETTLALCQEAFPLVCLIGDPGQLPPVKEAGVLAEVPGVDLTEVHRQAAESPILQLATLARAGTVDWAALPLKDGELQEWLGVEAAQFLTAPLIVWRNTTRLGCTAAIRQALGYPADRLVPGEPLVCRATNQEDRADGFINNTLWRVVKVSGTDPTSATVQEEGDEAHTHTVTLHIEELHGEAIHPRAGAFRFGYCLTANNAQGGEWRTVYIAKADMRAQGGFAKRSPTPEDGPRWAYTAITRAKQTLGLLTQYDFSAMLPAVVRGGNMPTMTAQETQRQAALDAKELAFAAEGQPLTPPIDDVPDPVQPLQTIAAQAAERVASPTVNPNTVEGQVLMMVDEAVARVADQATSVLDAVNRSWDSALRVLNHNNNAIMCLKEALQAWSPHTPYAVKIYVVSPSGFPMDIQVEALTQESFLEKVGAQMAFLNQHGFRAREVAGVAF